MSAFGFNLNNIVNHSNRIQHISRQRLKAHDCLLVKTHNSLYTIRKIDEKYYHISGGWFDKNGLSPCKMKIRGCTWGGSVIHINMVAACGLRLEFGNNVITSPVNRIMVIRGSNLN